MSYITLNKKNFFSNLTQITQHVGDINKVAIVLKDNAYGHGLTQMATLSQEFGLKHAVVRTIREAQEVEDYFNTILILADNSSDLIPSNAHLTINDISMLEILSPQTKIELKFDTGMHRNGLHSDELEKAFTLIAKHKLHLKGIFSHHRSADLLSSEYFWQEKNFEAIKEKAMSYLRQHKLTGVRFHMQNSAATMRVNKSHDIVRVGIAAYGLLEMPKALATLSFKPVLSLWAQKLHTFSSTKHMRHGYEAKGRLSKDSKVSSYDVGYADGLLRLQDDVTYTLPNLSNIIGRISMDNLLINCEEASVCIYNDARSYAKVAQTISYEVCTRLHSAIPRKFS